MARMMSTPSLGCGYAPRERAGQEEGSGPVVFFAQGITLSLGASYGTLSFGRLQRFCIRKLGVHRVAPNCGVAGLKDFA